MSLPQHVAIIMDGNGRWAKKRMLPRVAGHKAGIEAVRKTVKSCAEKGIKILTLFAFSSENWQRPQDEVRDLMHLFLIALQREIKKLHKNNVYFKIIGDISAFNPTLQQQILEAEKLTAHNTGLKLLIAANYGGRWDIINATKKLAAAVVRQEIHIDDIDEMAVTHCLSTAGLPHPDLLIRTSGEKRISNFLLWQLAYAELYFTQIYWPDFDETELTKALDFFASRERRFGSVSESLQKLQEKEMA